ncbi:MAG TPA: hypothetical protein PLI09_10610 [Candidatus Hydrogenedentes bacterium]|nr:hypothetical protein [Candidatus Hydrogenedentota bacterium]
MPSRISKEDAEIFTRRWELVNAAQREELRQMTPEERLRRLDALYVSAREMGWNTRNPEEEAKVRETWLALRRYYGVR